MNSADSDGDGSDEWVEVRSRSRGRRQRRQRQKRNDDAAAVAAAIARIGIGAETPQELDEKMRAAADELENSVRNRRGIAALAIIVRLSVYPSKASTQAR